MRHGEANELVDCYITEHREGAPQGMGELHLKAGDAGGLVRCSDWAHGRVHGDVSGDPLGVHHGDVRARSHLRRFQACIMGAR